MMVIVVASTLLFSFLSLDGATPRVLLRTCPYGDDVS
jgi:hypothetical protein